MTQARLPEVNAKIARAATELFQTLHVEVELVRGQGYHYMTLTERDAQGTVIRYESESIMVPYLSSLTSEQWMESAMSFMKEHV